MIRYSLSQQKEERGRKVGWPAQLCKRAALLSCSMLFLLFCAITQTCVAQEEPDLFGIQGYKGMEALPRAWRPFNNNSPWNMEISTDAGTHFESGSVTAFMNNSYGYNNRYIRFQKEWNPTLHVVKYLASSYFYWLVRRICG